MTSPIIRRSLTILLVACSIPAWTAETPATTVLRDEEGSQRGLATSTTATAEQLGEIVDQLRFNGVADPAEQRQLAELRQRLEQLAQGDGKAEVSMIAAADAIGKARQSGARADLSSAVGTAQELVKHLESVVAANRGETGKSGSQRLARIASQQKKLMERTQNAQDRLLGQDERSMSADDKALRNGLAQQQRELNAALAALAAAAATSPDDPAAAVARVAKSFGDQAARDIAANRLDDAADKQLQVIAALNKVASTEEQQVSPSSTTTLDGLAELQQRAEAIEALDRLAEAQRQELATLQQPGQSPQGQQPGSPQATGEQSPPSSQSPQAAQGQQASQPQQGQQGQQQSQQGQQGQQVQQGQQGQQASQPQQGQQGQQQSQQGQQGQKGQKGPQGQKSQKGQQASQPKPGQPSGSPSSPQAQRQQGIANALAQQQASAAAQSAQQASQALSQGDQAAAASAMNETLSKIAEARAQLAADQQAALAAAMASTDQQMAALANAISAQQANMAAAASASSPSAANQAQSAQSALASQMQQGSMPGAAAAAQAASQLGQGQQAPAQASMQSALKAMQAGQAQLTQAMASMQGMAGAQSAAPSAALAIGGPPGMESKEGPRQDQPEQAAIAARQRRGQWEVTRDPVERQVLTSEASERFPAGYERQLSDYYRKLAEGSR